MKTIVKGGEILRKSDMDAEFLFRNEGWFYCPKSEWKIFQRKKQESKINRKTHENTQSKRRKNT